MESKLVLAAVVALEFLAGWVCLLRKPIVNSGAPISSNARTGYWYLGLMLIAFGAVNLFFGFRDGEMFWISKRSGYDGWLPYEGYKRAFIYLGVLYSFSVIVGFCIIKVFALGRRKEQ
jgi:hypothetical protein